MLKTMRYQKSSVNKAFKYSEVIAFILFILLIAFILFPKFYILKTLNNLNLGGSYIKKLYLENIIKHHDISDKELEKIIIFYIKFYNYKEAKDILTTIKNSNYKLKTLPLLEYYVLKEEYFSTISLRKKFLIKEKMTNALIEYLNKNPTKESAIIVYKESKQMDIPKAEALALYRLSSYTDNINLIKEAITMAMYFKDKQELQSLVKKLMNARQQTTKDKLLIYDICNYLNDINCKTKYFKEFKNDKSFIKIHYNEIIMDYVKNKNLRGINYVISTLPQDLKKKAIEQSITYSLWNKDYNLAKVLILKYINFSKDPDFINFMVKNSLATADKDFIKKVGNEVLKLYEE